MSKRAISESGESSGPSVKRQSNESSIVSGSSLEFVSIPEDDILHFDDTRDIRVDFNVLEYIASKNDLLITHTMKKIYRELQKNDSPFTVLLHGASGVGKTMTLMFVGHMARKSGCLVFPIQAKKFVNQERPLSCVVRSFLLFWSNAVGEKLLKKLRCTWTSFANLFDLIKDGLSDMKKTIECFQISSTSFVI
jgi:hypothetical protein